MDGNATREELTRIAATIGERSGWDFSSMITVREPVPWDYPELVPRYLRPTDVILDAGANDVPAGFSIARDWHTVSRIIARYSTPRGIETNEHRTLLIARKDE
jgi:hypothetical protein